MLAVTRPPHLVIPGLPPPSSPTSLLRHPRPRSGTYARVILATDPKPIITPSSRPPSRYPWAGRGNHHNHLPPHPHPSTFVPAKERHPVPRYGAGTQGTGAVTPINIRKAKRPTPPNRRPRATLRHTKLSFRAKPRNLSPSPPTSLTTPDTPHHYHHHR